MCCSRFKRGVLFRVLDTEAYLYGDWKTEYIETQSFIGKKILLAPLNESKVLILDVIRPENSLVVDIANL